MLMCAKEHSCENCRELPPPDTIRTTPNELITSCSIYIADEDGLKWIYPEQTNKLYPQTWKIFDSIKIDIPQEYNRTYDLKNYLPMDKFVIGDTIFIRYEIRWIFKPTEWFGLDTLVY